jgi:5-methylcytosine-specific restriction endonuclease McrA
VEATSSGRHIPLSVCRAVWERDGGQCTHVTPSGRRCESKWMIEYDHILEFARGGEPTVDNVRLLCRGHNQYEAECTYGRDFMESKRAAAADPKGDASPIH